MVTGGSRNSGRAICEALADAGAKVAIVWQSNEAGAVEACKAITEAGGTAEPFHLDLLSVRTIEATTWAMEAAFGPVDILVNNAAIRPERELAEVTPELWDEIFGINVRG